MLRPDSHRLPNHDRGPVACDRARRVPSAPRLLRIQAEQDRQPQGIGKVLDAAPGRSDLDRRKRAERQLGRIANLVDDRDRRGRSDCRSGRRRPPGRSPRRSSSLGRAHLSAQPRQPRSRSRRRPRSFETRRQGSPARPGAGACRRRRPRPKASRSPDVRSPCARDRAPRAGRARPARSRPDGGRPGAGGGVAHRAGARRARGGRRRPSAQAAEPLGPLVSRRSTSSHSGSPPGSTLATATSVVEFPTSTPATSTARC